MIDESELGRRVAKRRESLGLSARQAAALVGCASSTWTRLEAGRHRASVELLAAIGASLGLELRELYTLAGYPVPDALPELRPYIRMKFKDLPPKAFEEIETFVELLRAKYRIEPGPEPGVDERLDDLSSDSR